MRRKKSKSKIRKKRKRRQANREKWLAWHENLRKEVEIWKKEPAPRRRLLGISSRGISFRFDFNYDLEIPYDPEDPVSSVERAQEAGAGWAEDGYPTRGDA